MFKGKQANPPVNKLDIFCYRWRHANVIFLCLYTIGFTDEDKSVKC